MHSPRGPLLLVLWCKAVKLDTRALVQHRGDWSRRCKCHGTHVATVWRHVAHIMIEILLDKETLVLSCYSGHNFTILNTFLATLSSRRLEIQTITGPAWLTSNLYTLFHVKSKHRQFYETMGRIKRHQKSDIMEFVVYLCVLFYWLSQPSAVPRLALLVCLRDSMSLSLRLCSDPR